MEKISGPSIGLLDSRYAKVDLSNLASVALNASLVPDANKSYSIGSLSKHFLIGHFDTAILISGDAGYLAVGGDGASGDKGGVYWNEVTNALEIKTLAGVLGHTPDIKFISGGEILANADLTFVRDGSNNLLIDIDNKDHEFEIIATGSDLRLSKGAVSLLIHTQTSPSADNWFEFGGLHKLTDGTYTVTIANLKTAYDHSQLISGNPHLVTLDDAYNAGKTITVDDGDIELNVPDGEVYFLFVYSGDLGGNYKTSYFTDESIGVVAKSGAITTSSYLTKDTLFTPEVRATGVGGLGLYEDGGAGIFVKDGGNVGIGTSTPAAHLEISKADPELRLTDTGDSEYTRVTRADTSGKAVRYNRVYEPGAVLDTIHFDADYVTCGNDSSLRPTGDITLEGWFRFDTVASEMYLIAKYTTSGNKRSFALVFGLGGSDELTFRTSSNGTATLVRETTNANIVADTWYHLAVTYDASDQSAKFYKNGVLLTDDGTSINSALNSNDGNFILGDYDGFTLPFDGKMTEVRVWEGILVAADLVIHATNPTNVSADNTTGETLLAHWKCDEGSGESLADSSANTNTGTFKGVGEPAWANDEELIAGADTEVLIWQSQDGTGEGEEGIQTFGDPDGRTVIQGATQRFFIGANEKVRIDASGNLGIGLTPTANMLGLSVEAGLLTIKETTAPTADTNYGKLWTDTNNELWFQSGDGNNHLLHGDAFSNIWFHSSTAAVVTIGTEDAFTLVDSFTVVGNEDDLSIVVGNVSTNTLTLSAIGGGEYEISYHVSITATGASKEILTCIGITLATAKDITNVTDDTVSPIVITSTAHGFEDGDMVEIAGVLGNTAANGSFIVDNKTANTFEIVALDGTATTGNGDFDEGSPTGDVTIWYPGNMVSHREVSQTDIGSVSATGLHILQNSDVLSLYMANLDDTNNINIYAVSLEAYRIGD